MVPTNPTDRLLEQGRTFRLQVKRSAGFVVLVIVLGRHVLTVQLRPRTARRLAMLLIRWAMKVEAAMDKGGAG